MYYVIIETSVNMLKKEIKISLSKGKSELYYNSLNDDGKIIKELCEEEYMFLKTFGVVFTIPDISCSLKAGEHDYAIMLCEDTILNNFVIRSSFETLLSAIDVNYHSINFPRPVDIIITANGIEITSKSWVELKSHIDDIYGKNKAKEWYILAKNIFGAWYQISYNKNVIKL